MAKKQLTEEQKKEIAILQANNEMLERTKREAKARGKDSVSMIEVAQQEVIEHIGLLDQNVAKKVVEQNNKVVKEIDDIIVDTHDEKSVYDALNEINGTQTPASVSSVYNSFEEDNFDAQYDVITLPSNGEAYKDKLSRLPVAYLTAYDENFITSPNLYRDGLVIDFLLKNKIMKKDIDIDSLLSGDVDAITLFLRATSYGVEFPITVRDPQTGKQIDSVVDLSTLKIKDFNLKGDENGHFSFELPLSHDVIKFRYLTRRDEKNLELVSKIESKNANSSLLRKILNELNDIMDNDDSLTTNETSELKKSFETIDTWRKKLSESMTVGYNKLITNRMEMNVVAVNGNYDRKYIHSYVKNMRAKDALELRKYINENEPGVDFEITVERPESLGGGSFKTFLEWNDSIFLNIA